MSNTRRSLSPSARGGVQQRDDGFLGRIFEEGFEQVLQRRPGRTYSRSSSLLALSFVGVKSFWGNGLHKGRSLTVAARYVCILAKMGAVSTKRQAKRSGRYRLLRHLLRWTGIAVLLFYGFAALGLVVFRWIDPPFTSVHIERRVESWFHKGAYHKKYSFVPLAKISPDFQHAVVAAEDARFYLHHGFDWKQVENAVEDTLEDGRIRGASTITQQLVKNLFLTTWRSPVRKALEVPLVPLAEGILSKQRILELYMNVVEWGPGVYGAEAAARYHYGTSASRINRERGARLAAILPAPRRRKPARMNAYAARILERMGQVRW